MDPVSPNPSNLPPTFNQSCLPRHATEPGLFNAGKIPSFGLLKKHSWRQVSKLIFLAEAEDKRNNEDYNDVKEVIEGVEAKEIEVLEKISPIEKPVNLC